MVNLWETLDGFLQERIVRMAREMERKEFLRDRDRYWQDYPCARLEYTMQKLKAIDLPTCGLSQKKVNQIQKKIKKCEALLEYKLRICKEGPENLDRVHRECFFRKAKMREMCSSLVEGQRPHREFVEYLYSLVYPGQKIISFNVGYNSLSITIDCVSGRATMTYFF